MRKEVEERSAMRNRKVVTTDPAGSERNVAFVS
jgi:hypothetical protein